MAVFDALSVRDFVALVMMATRTLAEPQINSDALVEEAFRVADQYVERSEGRWASTARANHQQFSRKSPKG